LCFNRLNLILRSPAKRSEAGRLEGWAAMPIYDSGYWAI
jgi:hypothetical protein